MATKLTYENYVVFVDGLRQCYVVLVKYGHRLCQLFELFVKEFYVQKVSE